MSLIDLLVLEFDAEISAARRVLERVPDDSLTWQPHHKSMTLGRLATHVAQLPAWTPAIMSRADLDFAVPEDRPQFTAEILPSTSEIVAELDRTSGAARAALAGADEASLDAPWALRRGAQAVFTLPRALAYRRMVLNHLVHHRGQLSVYLRLLGVPVPGVYGPSADEQ